MSLEQFDSLAAGNWDQATAQELRNNELSIRMLNLHALWREVRGRPEAIGPLAPLDTAMRLLSTAEAADPDAVRDLLVHPTVGMWLAHTRSRLRGDAVVVDEMRPLWADVGYAHTLAAVAAQRVGHEVSLEVPMYDGRVMLPTLGRATLPSGSGKVWRTAEVHTADGSLAVSHAGDTLVMPDCPEEDAPGWEGARWLTFEASNGQTWKVLLDDLDEFSGLQGPITPVRLKEPGVEAWRRVLGGAWELLAIHHPTEAGQITGIGGLRTIVPELPRPRFQPYSSSSGYSTGSATMSRPYEAVEAAVTLVHEYCGHTVLNLALHLLQLVEQQQDGLNQNYAPWRDDPRPTVGLLHGVTAFLAVVTFWHDEQQRLGGSLVPESGRALAGLEFADWGGKVYNGAVELLTRSAELTDHGQRFAHKLLQRVEPLQEAVLPDSRLIAYALSLDHVLRWGNHHVRVAEGPLEEAARSWAAGSPEPPPGLFEQLPDLVPNSNARGLDVAAVLVRLGITAPYLLSQPSMLPREATPADVALATFLLEQTNVPADRWEALERMLGPLLEAQHGTPRDLSAALQARISRDSAEPPPVQAVTQWVAKGLLAHLRRRGGSVPLLPRYRREGDERIVQETLQDTIRRVEDRELPVLEGVRLLMALGFLGIGTAASAKVYEPRILVTNIPPNGMEQDGTVLPEAKWWPRIASDGGSPLAVVRAGRDPFTAVWGAAVGDPHEPFQRERLGLSFLPPQWDYYRGFGGWVANNHRPTGYSGRDYTGVAHVDFADALQALPPDEKVGSIDMVHDDGDFTGEVPYEPGHAVSLSSKNTVGSLTVRAADVQGLLSGMSIFRYPPRRRRR